MSVSVSLCDLPIELLTTLVFTELSPFDLARLCQVNVKLNNAVCQYLIHTKTLKMPRDQDFPCWNDSDKQKVRSCPELRAHQRKCFNFMARHAANLVTLGDDTVTDFRYTDFRYRWMLSADLIKVIKKNPKLEIIDVRGMTISHRVLKQLLLCEKLRFLR